MCETLKPLIKSRIGRKAEIAFKLRYIGIRRYDVARLHGRKLYKRSFPKTSFKHVIWHNGKQRNNVRTRTENPLIVNGVDINKYYNEMHD